MGKVVADISVSPDGFVTGPGAGPARLGGRVTFVASPTGWTE
ncbi:hypothetical protein [Pseudosporangium ferrugineum]|uniref:Uncharacterized protein n=1 Tax=Pseudosporangium ferrugineum TaxID=439699 RepID=A0A2T0S961_9ACTN|nr:hypothetical protein [Pseudosporangium ferrugineum]PRY29853.1 hypothetical protein CLV70_10521 [Pseudosporangium ferrugineum]